VLFGLAREEKPNLDDCAAGACIFRYERSALVIVGIFNSAGHKNHGPRLFGEGIEIYHIHRKRSVPLSQDHHRLEMGANCALRS